MTVIFCDESAQALSDIPAAHALCLLLLFSSLFVSRVDGDMILDGGGGSSPGGDSKLSFLARWHDPESDRQRDLVLSFFPGDGSVQMFEPGRRQWLLRRSRPAGDLQVHAEDFFPGGWVRVYGRRLLLLDYADEHTRRQVEPVALSTFAMLKPDGAQHLGDVLETLTGAGLRVTAARMAQFSAEHAASFYSEHRGRPFFPRLVQYVSECPVIGLRLMGPEAVAVWRRLIGPTDSARARKASPQSLRARFGTDGTRNAFHGSDGPQTAARELDWFFGKEAPPAPTEAPGAASTCAVLLPHVVRAGQAGDLLRVVSGAGFLVTGLRLEGLSEERAGNLLAVYRGVVPEFPAMVAQLSSGPALALRLAAPCAADREAAVEQLRDLTGPRDPAVAALLRPHSLRARFGVDRVLNAIHCSDMAEEAAHELCFFFGDDKQC